MEKYRTYPAALRYLICFGTLAVAYFMLPLFSVIGQRVLVIAGMAQRQAGTRYLSGTHSMAFVTVPSMDVAKSLAGHLVKERLAACVNIIPQVTSVYEWEGKIEQDSELILMIKTTTEKIDELSTFVRENHPYDCAEVISAKIDNGNSPYLDWISQIVHRAKTAPSNTETKPDQ